MIITNFYKDVLRDYENALDVFFDPDTGAVYEPGREDGAPKFLFTEVTGYALLDFLLLHRISGNRAYLAKAIKSADWIKDHAQDPTGGVLTRYYFELDTDPELADKSFTGRKIFAFDVAICLRGMVATYKETGDQSYLQSAIRMGDFLTDTMTDQKGEVHAIYDALKSKPLKSDKSKWSRCPGAFHTKVAEALIDLYDIAKQDKYFSAANAICNNALKFQSKNGHFETSSGMTELHPYCYATEGMLHVGRKTNNIKFIDSARRATEWALKKSKNGEIAQTFDFSTEKPLSRFRTDALAQVLALGSDLLQMGQISETYSEILNQLAMKILAMKKDGHGYFCYGYYEREIGGKIEADTRSYWTNMFCMRGLSKYYISWLLENTCVAILAGGIGSRIWPISCENRPKPVSLSLLGDRSLLTETIRRYTHDYFVRPEKIYILCSKSALEMASSQAMKEGVPEKNCILELEPKGTIPAVNLAIQGMPKIKDAHKRIIIVSMADNVIEPFETFQGAVTTALFVARENDCLLSIGNPFDKNKTYDERFGHMLFTNRVEESYRSFKVNRFEEKPNPEKFEMLRKLPGSMAWESGTVIFREGYFRSVIPKTQSSGNLAEHALSRAAPWASQTDKSIKVATSVLDKNIRFEDFGVPGQNVLNFFRGTKNDRGDGNICLGSTDKIRMLACTNSLVISDDRAIEVCGLHNFVVIDSIVTNTTVIMKLQDVQHLPNLYRLFLGSKKYEPYISGGPRALTAEPTTFIEKSPNTRANSDYGLVFAYNFNERLQIERTQNGLKIINNDLPEMEREDFDLLLLKQKEDPMLTRHLINVGAVAKAIVEGMDFLTQESWSILNHLCLYHAFGGYLTEEGEKQEKAAFSDFKRISKLDRRMLDSSVVAELINLYGHRDHIGDHEFSMLINVNVNSAIEYISKRKTSNSNLRDIVVGLLQYQDSPYLISSFIRNLENMEVDCRADELATVFSCFKIAQIFSNGRWLWKRTRKTALDARQTGLLRFSRGPYEEFPFIVAFAIRWLKSADIDPVIYVKRLNELLIDNESVFMKLMNRLQEGKVNLVCDEIYTRLIQEGKVFIDQIEHLLSQQSSITAVQQLRHIIELPGNLKEISGYCDDISESMVNQVHEIILDFYHKNWKLIKPHVDAGVIAKLL